MKSVNAPVSVHRLRQLLLAALCALTTVSEASFLNLSDAPIYLATSVEPNVVLTFDDSGSMAWAYLPDTLDDGGGVNPNDTGAGGLGDNARGCASNINRLYYDPSITYVPPVKQDGTSLNATETSFSAAYMNGFNPTGSYNRPNGTSGSTVNLGGTNQYRPSWGGLDSYDTCGQAMPTTPFYFVYDSTLGGTCPPASVNKDACYRRVNVTSASTEAQNFAIWFSYYRTRNMLAKTAAGRAFARLGTNVRIGGHHLNGTGGSTGSSTARFGATVPALQRFCNDPTNTDPLCPDGSTARTDFFTRLYDSPNSSGTPLRPALQRVGDSFGSGNTGSNSPYRDNPGGGTTNNPERSCRQNFHVLLTDGYWNGGAGVSTNVDGTNQTLGDGTGYGTPKAPYSDSTAATLADNAFNYWYRDLRTDLANNVPTRFTSRAVPANAAADYFNPVNDPANWQHLVNFTISLGINGTLNFPGDYNTLVAGTTPWPAAVADTATAIDDLWHAAINSRGRYFSASNPTELVSSFSAIINDVADRVSSSSAVAVNAASLSGSQYVYQARFNSGDWSGQVLSYRIDPATSRPDVTPTRDASVELAQINYDSRAIITYRTPSIDSPVGTGVKFRWPANPAAPNVTSEINAEQIKALNYNPVTAAQDPAGSEQGQARLNFLRGDASNEGVGNNYRTRSRQCGAVACPSGTNTGALGDIINSAPLFVASPSARYPDTLEGVSAGVPLLPYSTFRNSATNRNRTPMVYAGGNDGMLHGFDANTLVEKIAYVPSEVYPNLTRLTDPAYTHKYYVDGDITVADAVVDGKWRTLLAGSLRKGGQGIYVLDVTDPSRFSEANASSLVLWEFTDNDDKDLGYTFSRPIIAKMSNGKWAVIFGNGYNNTENDGASTTSTTGHAALYIVFLDQTTKGKWTASDYVKIDTNVGTVTTPNGLATPAVVDENGDFIADFIFAGDREGNMWKFDVRDSDKANWNISNAGNPIFTAKDAASPANRQPITERPIVQRHPSGLPGFLVMFGTGKYLETGDSSIVGATTQTFYGIWDESGIASPTRANLLQQTVTQTATALGTDYRIISANLMTWRYGNPLPSPSYVGWYLDLPTTGERQVTNPQLRSGAIIFTTLIPSSDPCSVGGDGWLMVLDAASGGRTEASIFDVDGNGIVDGQDTAAINISGSPTVANGQKVIGIPSAPTIYAGGNPTAPYGGGCNGQDCVNITSSDGSIKNGTISTPDCNYCTKSWNQMR